MKRPLLLAPVLALTALAMSGCFGDSDSDETPTPSATIADETPTVISTAPAATQSPTPEPIAVSGLFDEPGARIEPSSTVTLPGRPDPSFPEFPPINTVLYDVQEGTATDLGPGTLGQFSPDGRYMAWVADGDIHLLETTAETTRTIGQGSWVQGLSNRTLISGNTAYDLETGASSNAGSGPRLVNAQSSQGDLSLRLVEGTAGFGDTYLFVVEREEADATWTTLLEVRAHWARFAGEGELIVVTATQSDRHDPGSIPFAPGTRNLFTVDIGTGEATFVSTVSAFGTTPFSASERYIAWTEDYCANDSVTVLLDRTTGQAARIDGGSWIEVTRTNLLADGWGFGAQALIDPETMEYLAVLPDSSIDVRWSADYRYASTGEYGGHGGHCGG